MVTIVVSVIAWLGFSLSDRIDECNQCIVLCEQSQHRIMIVDATSSRTLWEWTAGNSNIAPKHIKWFDHPDEAKPVYNNKYLLITASGGGVALIRISDKKTVFYVFAGGNPHSAEMLPDGNIVSSSSTGNILQLFKVDTLNFPDKVLRKSYPVIDGHNVVWDKRRKVLWAGSGERLHSYTYDANCEDPALSLADSLDLPGNLHDLFPIYGMDALWVTTDMHVYSFDLSSKKFKSINSKHPDHIKSVSSGPGDFPVVMIHPKEEWWSDEVISLEGHRVFMKDGYKIYKARWFLENHFSYPVDHEMMVCRQ
jgi:hypothetical protein